LSKFKVILLKVGTMEEMEEKDTDKKTYEEPTLVKHEELIDIIENGIQTAGSGGTLQV